MIGRCVACGSDSWSSSETSGGYLLATCARCGATFTRNPDYGTRRYVAAYEGGEEGAPVSREHGFVYTAPAQRLEMETLALFAPPPRLTASQRLAIRWLKEHAVPGAAVIDCGCGSGLFLRALKGAGIRGVGVEVSRALVELLSRKGLEVITGEVPDFPWTGRPPFAVTFFEVLEHFPDPSEVIGDIVKRFPRASILASVPSPLRARLLLHGERSASDFPPNHFVRWTPRALEMFFHNRGFGRVTVMVPPPPGSELLPGLGQVFRRSRRPIGGPSAHGSSRASLSRRVAITGILWLHKCYQVAADVIGALAARRAGRRGASSSSMLVVAE